VIRTTPDGLMLDVRVVPRSSRSGVAGGQGGEPAALRVHLHAPPVEGAATAELIEVLASALGVPTRSVSIARGERSRSKRVRVTGIDEATARQRLAAASSPAA
jgi:uncharacterized protein (TIGR00251 family)